LGHENIEVAYSLHCIAKINRKQHDLEAAREHFNASLRIKRLKLPKNHTSIAETLEQLGSLYLDLGQEDEGVLCLNAALVIYKSKHGDGVKVAQMNEQLGGSTNGIRTLPRLSRTFIDRCVFGSVYWEVSTNQLRICTIASANCSVIEKSYHEALASFQAATKIRKKAFGRDDMVISDILTDAGILQMKLGQVDIADKCFSEALRIRNLILDPRHEKIGECLMLNGSVLVEKTRYSQAIELFLEALSIFSDNSGAYGLLCADAYQSLGRVYKLMNDYDKAQDNYDTCLKVRKGHQGDDHLDVARVTYGLGEVYFAKGEYRRAEEYFRDSVEVMVSHLGDNHLDVANAVLCLGRTCNKLQSPDEAMMYFEQARLIKNHHLGDQSLEVIDIDVEIGRSHAVKHEYDEALAMLPDVPSNSSCHDWR
jgi:tetratricopeptide (TPR) repeat protein